MLTWYDLESPWKQISVCSCENLSGVSYLRWEDKAKNGWHGPIAWNSKQKGQKPASGALSFINLCFPTEVELRPASPSSCQDFLSWRMYPQTVKQEKQLLPEAAFITIRELVNTHHREFRTSGRKCQGSWRYYRNSPQVREGWVVKGKEGRHTLFEEGIALGQILPVAYQYFRVQTGISDLEKSGMSPCQMFPEHSQARMSHYFVLEFSF